MHTARVPSACARVLLRILWFVVSTLDSIEAKMFRWRPGQLLSSWRPGQFLRKPVHQTYEYAIISVVSLRSLESTMVLEILEWLPIRMSERLERYWDLCLIPALD